jgi:hypothetical protein
VSPPFVKDDFQNRSFKKKSTRLFPSHVSPFPINFTDDLDFHDHDLKTHSVSVRTAVSQQSAVTITTLPATAPGPNHDKAPMMMADTSDDASTNMYPVGSASVVNPSEEQILSSKSSKSVPAMSLPVMLTSSSKQQSRLCSGSVSASGCESTSQLPDQSLSPCYNTPIPADLMNSLSPSIKIQSNQTCVHSHQGHENEKKSEKEKYKENEKEKEKENEKKRKTSTSSLSGKSNPNHQTMHAIEIESSGCLSSQHMEKYENNQDNIELPDTKETQENKENKETHESLLILATAPTSSPSSRKASQNELMRLIREGVKQDQLVMEREKMTDEQVLAEFMKFKAITESLVAKAERLERYGYVDERERARGKGKGKERDSEDESEGERIESEYERERRLSDAIWHSDEEIDRDRDRDRKREWQSLDHHEQHDSPMSSIHRVRFLSSLRARSISLSLSHRRSSLSDDEESDNDASDDESLPSWKRETLRDLAFITAL